MTTPVVQSPVPPRDAAFSHLLVATTAVRGLAPRDALFSNLNVGKTDYSQGQTPRDLSLTHLAVTGTINGTVSGNGQSVIGHL